MGPNSRSENRCPLCGSSITDIQITVRWKDYGGGGYCLEGKCFPCGVDVFKSVSKEGTTDWYMSVAEKEWLTEQLGPDEIERLTGKLSRYSALGPKWHGFLKKKRASDELWRFVNHDNDEKTAIALVRNGIPIADYGLFSNL